MKYLVGTLLVIGVPLVYAGRCWWFPFGDCWCCDGKGKHRSKSGRHFRDCWWCKGGGRRLRLGRRVWNYFAAARKAAG